MNSFGTTFRLTTFGESHGSAIGGIVDGCPAGIAIDQDFVDAELRRRRIGDGATICDITSRQEEDKVEWLSGIYEGKTLGTPIAFLIHNNDCREADYALLRDCFRPGHADYTYQQKYGHRDHRGGGRASGRETAVRVVAGAMAKQILAQQNIHIAAKMAVPHICCTIEGLPAGVGEPIFDRLNARLAYAMFSIPSCMSFTMGDTPEAWMLSRNEFPDQWTTKGEAETLTQTNHCGGIQGGISNGMPVVFYIGFHQPVTNPEGMNCRTAEGDIVNVAPHGRHDRDHYSRIPVIVESMAAITILDLLYQQK